MFKKIFEIRDNLSIRKRIVTLLIGVSLLLIIYILTLSNTLYTFQENISKTQKNYTEKLIKLSDFVGDIYGIIIKSHILNQNSLNSDVVNNTLEIDLLESQLQNFKSKIYESQIDIYNNLLYESQNYVLTLKEINSLELQGKYKQALDVKSDKEIVSFNKLQKIIESLQKISADKLISANLQAYKIKNKMIIRLSSGGALLVIFIFLITIFMFSGIQFNYNNISHHLDMLSKGTIPDKELVAQNNELGYVSSKVNALSQYLFKLNKFASNLSQGNYTSNYETEVNNDVLGKALIDLQNNLNQTRETDKERKIEDERRNWVNSGHALFGEILRQRSQGINHLADDIIKNVVHYLSANQGGLFIINDDKIELIAAFAYDRKKFVEREVAIGDGLIGTVALEKNTIFLKEIPEDYIEIESGLGEASPKNLLIVPLKFEDDVLGVVEIASFKELQDYEIKFVEELGQSIASTLLTVKINEQTEQLLNDSRKKSEELSLREVEARNNMEKMKSTQELARQREADLTGILTAVDNTLMKGEYELDGTLISVNDRHLQTMGYQLKEIKGKNIEIFIPKDELENFRQIWASVISGKARQIEVKRRTKTGEILWLINQYTPVTDSTGKINRVLYLAHDVTQYKVQSENQTITQDNIEEIDKLKKEIIERTNQLKEVEEKIKTLTKQKETTTKYLDSDVDKMYTKWIDSFE